jgi:hypothetical protein
MNGVTGVSASTGGGGGGGTGVIRLCYGEPPMQFCFAAKPTATKMLSDSTSLSTDNCGDARTASGGTTVCVFAFDKVTVSGTARVIGDLPAVIIGVSLIEIGMGATLDLAGSSSPVVIPAANAQPTACSVFESADERDGGAGGSFMSAGGKGGAIGGTGPSPALALSLGFHGGCRGGPGAGGATVVAGSGGGAVYLISEKITVDGVITANGGGGGGGGMATGGGGGGSGGYVGLDAPEIVLGASSAILARGGGGGGGGDAGVGQPGSTGGGGGVANGNGGEGGAGSVGAPAQAGSMAATGTAGSGGGGGGAGAIQFFRFGNGCNRCTPALTMSPLPP